MSRNSRGRWVPSLAVMMRFSASSDLMRDTATMRASVFGGGEAVGGFFTFRRRGFIDTVRFFFHVHGEEVHFDGGMFRRAAVAFGAGSRAWPSL